MRQQKKMIRFIMGLAIALLLLNGNFVYAKDSNNVALQLEATEELKAENPVYFTENGIQYVEEIIWDGTKQISDLDQHLCYKYDSKTKSYYLAGVHTQMGMKVVIPDTLKGKKITHIGDNAFRGYDTVSVTLGKYITSIGKTAFEYCEELEEIILSDALTTIGEAAFRNCGIKAITIPKNVKTIGKEAFAYCFNLAEVTINEGKLKSLPENCFWRMNALESITLPKNITKLGDRCLSENDSLKEIVIKGKVKTIPYAFCYDCPSLKKVKIPETVTKIGMYAFSITGLEDITIPSKVTDLGQASFENCTELKTVTIKGPVKEIKMQTFKGCTSLYQVNASKKVKNVDSKAFEGCNRQNLTIIAPKGSAAYKVAMETKVALASTSKEIRFNVNTGLMVKGESKQISVYNYPGVLEWKSSKPSVVSVTKNGYVTAKKAGSAKLTATCGNQKFTLQMQVLNRTKENVLRVIYAEYVRPEMSDYQKVVAAHNWLVQNVEYDFSYKKNDPSTWGCSKADYVFERGLAICSGYADAFKVIMEHYGIPCKIVTSLAMDHAWNAVKIDGHWYHVDCTWDDPTNYNGESERVVNTYLLKSDKEFAKHHSYDFSCKTSSYNKVNTTSKTKSATGNQQVKEKPAVVPYLNAFRVTVAKGGEKFTLKLSGTKAKKFTSTNNKVATVDKKGVITAKKKGTATIKVKGADGKTYTCKVTVVEPRLNKKTAYLVKGNSVTLKVNGTKDEVVWKSNKPKIATVNAKGKVTAVGNGTAKITATVNGLEMTCTVTCHVHSYTSKVTKKATCTTAGTKTYTCTCGDTYKETMEAIGHNYQWNVTKQPSATMAVSEADFGIRQSKCINCKHVRVTESMINTGSGIVCGYFDNVASNQFREAINQYRAEEAMGLDPFGNFGYLNLPAYEQDAAFDFATKMKIAEMFTIGTTANVDMYPGGIVKTYNGEDAATAQDYIDHTDYWMLESENHTKCGTACFYYDKEGAGEKYVGYWIFLVE